MSTDNSTALTKQYQALEQLATDAGISFTTPEGSVNQKFCQLCKIMIEDLGGTFTPLTGGTEDYRKATYLYQLALAVDAGSEMSGATPLLLDSAYAIWKKSNDGEPILGDTSDWRTFEYLTHSIINSNLWEDEFVTTWYSNGTLYFSGVSGETYNGTARWETLEGVFIKEDTFNTFNSPVFGITGQPEGFYRLIITGTFSRIDATSASWNTSLRTIENMGNVGWYKLGNAFKNCTGLKSVVSGTWDLSGIATNNGMAAMFNTCSALTSVDLSGGVVPASVVDRYNFWFHDCTSLVNLDLTGLDFSNISVLNGWLQGCTSLETVVFDSDLNMSSLTSATLNDSTAITVEGYNAMLIALDDAKGIYGTSNCVWDLSGRYYGGAGLLGSQGIDAHDSLDAGNWTLTDAGEL